MRIVVVALGVVMLGIVGIVVWTNVFRPPPATTRLAGVNVAVAGYTIDDLRAAGHHLHVQATVTSLRDVDECLGFTLDEPFAGRRLTPAAGTCPKPRAGRQTVELVFDKLSENDLQFPSHTLVWGIPGGRCGPILLAFGVCVVEQAGTTALELPGHQVLPSTFPFGSLGPLFSFPPR